jgi:hypothetical protein
MAVRIAQRCEQAGIGERLPSDRKHVCDEPYRLVFLPTEFRVRVQPASQFHCHRDLFLKK